MLDIGITLLLIVLTTAFWYLKSCLDESRRYGSTPCVSCRLPIVGHLLFFGKYSYKTFEEWSKTYGNIYRIQLGIRPAIVVNGQDDVKLITDMGECAGRPTLKSWEKLRVEFSFDYTSDGMKYRKKVIHALSAMKDYRFDEDADEVCEDMITKWTSDNEIDLGCNMQRDILFGTSKLMFRFCFGGSKSEEDEKDIATLIDVQDGFLQAIHDINLVDSLPWLLKVHPRIKKIYQEYLLELDIRLAVVTRQMEKHLREAKNDDFNQVDNVIDALRTVSRKNKDGTMLDHKGLMLQIQTIYAAAFDTIGATVNWCVTLFCKYPHIQNEVWEELQQHTDIKEMVTEQHTASLIKLEAYISEVLRYVTPIPLAIPRCTTEHIELKNNMIIPKDTFIFVNLWSANHDENIWTSPEKFQPERFIVNGKLDRSKIENVMSFSNGRRRCVGEVQARKVMNLLVANLLRRCEFSFADAFKNMDIDDVNMGLTLRPPEARVIARWRISSS